jgi:hypothetical protein
MLFWTWYAKNVHNSPVEDVFYIQHVLPAALAQYSLPRSGGNSPQAGSRKRRLRNIIP